ncbi:MAG: hypothetical protein AB7F88_12505 [Pyrinomonadaceae bacterium]
MALTSSAELLFKISGDASGGVAALNKTQAELKNLDAAAKSIGGSMQNIGSSLQGLGTALTAAITALAMQRMYGGDRRKQIKEIYDKVRSGAMPFEEFYVRVFSGLKS